MSATVNQRATTAQFGANAIPAGVTYPCADNTVGLKGTIGVTNASGYLQMGTAATGLVAVGCILENWDNTVTGHANGFVSAPVSQGVFPWNNSTAGDLITIAARGAACYIADNQTVALTDGGGTRSIGGIVYGVDTNTASFYYNQVYVQMGVYVGIAAGSAIGGALTISGVQPVTGAKTFSDGALILQSAGAVPTTFHTNATVARSFTFPDIASATAMVDAGTQTWTGVKTWASAADPVFAKEANHTLAVVDTTTAATAGGNLTIQGAKSGTSGTGGAVSVIAGAGDTSGAGGAAALTAGAGGSASGTGGAVAILAGAGSAGNAVGGAARLTAGAASGSGTGGAASMAAGAGGATGIGGALSLVAGLGGTGAAGGAMTVTSGAGGTSGTGGAMTVAAGAGGNAGAGGATAMVGGAAGGGNNAGGLASQTGGAGAGSGAGGASSLVGGVGGLTGAGGAIAVTGGAGGATSGTGGAVVIAGGAGSNGNANGGALTLRGGAKNGSGTNGVITIGDSGTSAVKIGNGFAITDPGNAGAIPVTFTGVCNMTSAGAETRTLAVPAFNGQEITLGCDTFVGNIVVTVATSYDTSAHTTITFTAAGQYCVLKDRTVAGVHKWALLSTTGGTTLG